MCKANASNEKIKDPSLPGSFYDGNLKLTYSMFGKGASNAASLKKLYDSNKWVELAKEVIAQKSIGYDVYYFYMAKSAQMLGFNDAAKIYADLALKVDDKCKGMTFYNPCQGLEIDREVFKLFPEMDLNAIVREEKRNAPVIYQAVKAPGLNENTAGPKGFGWFLLGVNESDIFAGKEVDGFKLLSKLELIDDDRMPAGLGKTMKGVVQTPLDNSPKSLQLGFDKSKLISINYNFGSGTQGFNSLNDTSRIISEKYGAPFSKINAMVNIECSYKNGAKFTHKKGSNQDVWYSYFGENFYIQTILEDDAYFSGCPDSLLKDVLYSSRSFTMKIKMVKRDLNSDADAKNKKNAF